jgi:hypothetical protein
MSAPDKKLIFIFKECDYIASMIYFRLKATGVVTGL